MKLTKDQLRQLISNPRTSSDGKDIYGLCPQCGHDEFGISIVENNHPFSCFRKSKCGFTGNIYTLLKHLNKFKEFVGEREINPEGLLLDVFETSEDIIQQQELTEVQPPVGWKRVFENEYLENERGMQSYQFEQYKIGVSRLKKDYITFLVEMEGKITGYVSRSIKSKAWIDAYNEEIKQTGGKKYLRYENSMSDFSKMLFGYDEIIKGKTTDVILVEGILSKTKTDYNLQLQTQNWLKCVATFGAKISEQQVQLLKDKGLTVIWLWFEADVLDKVKTIAAYLSTHFEVRVAHLNGFDPGDINEEQSLELMTKSVNFMQINLDYL